MFALILKRLAATLPVMLVVAIVIFSVLRLTPGDPAALAAGDSATIEQIAEMRAAMGLDKPIISQFLIWGSNLLQGNLGVSMISGQPVWDLIVDRAGPSISMTVMTLMIALIVSLPVGILSASMRGKAIDKIVMSGSILGFSVPVFIVAYVLIMIFSMYLQWLPVQGYQPLENGLWNHIKHLLLPALSLSTVYIALIARMVRSSVIETLNEDYIRTARAKGNNDYQVLIKHALPNAAIPILTIIGISITMLIGGVVITESVFNIPGLGRLVLDAVLSRDFNVIQALILVFSFVYILVNLLIDISYIFVDPRIKQ
jgi:peptide/nickel transport system permease protein